MKTSQQAEAMNKIEQSRQNLTAVMYTFECGHSEIWSRNDDGVIVKRNHIQDTCDDPRCSNSGFGL